MLGSKMNAGGAGSVPPPPAPDFTPQSGNPFGAPVGGWTFAILVAYYFTTEDTEDTEDIGKMKNKCKSVISKVCIINL